MGRKLRVVRVDDQFAGRYIAREEYSLLFGDGEAVMDPLELVTFPVGDRLSLAISGLSAAEYFWSEFSINCLPDIVIGDVDFEKDKTTPLQTWMPSEQNIPTGLTHVKPLAGVARATGAPLAVGLHTGDPERWSTFVMGTNHDHPNGRIFGLLAAHEVIELAAILGERIDRSGRDDLAPVWDWLQTRTRTTPRAALTVALVDYRRQVVERLRRATNGSDPHALRISAGSHAQLRAWCQRMANDPVPLGDSGVDVGLPLLYPDGRRDTINFSSLFADVDSILNDRLPVSCFDLTPPASGETIWELAAGLPRIGSLIAILGGVDAAVAAAERALAILSIGPMRLTSNLRDVAEDPLARGLAVLFRVIEIARIDDIAWSRVWSHGPWDPVQLKEPDSPLETDYFKKRDSPIGCPWADSLELWVDMVEQALRQAAEQEEGDPEAFVDLGLVVDALVENVRVEKGHDLTGLLEHTSVGVHLDILTQMGVAECRPHPAGGCQYRARQVHGLILPPPAPPTSVTGLVRASDRLPAALRDSLGFGAARGPANADNDNAVGIVLYSAFLAIPQAPQPAAAQQARAGRDGILSPFLRGDGPGWLVELCRAYARDRLGWTDQRTWPTCLRSQVGAVL